MRLRHDGAQQDVTHDLRGISTALKLQREIEGSVVDGRAGDAYRRFHEDGRAVNVDGGWAGGSTGRGRYRGAAERTALQQTGEVERDAGAGIDDEAVAGAIEACGLLRRRVGGQDLERIEAAVRGAYLEVQMLAGRVAGVATVAQQIALLNGLALLDLDLVEVAVEAAEAVAVVDDDVVAVRAAGVAASEGDDAAGRRQDGESAS